ncbi:MAG: hypothetical protein GKR87_01110 [Kiritimatiellae bacterium]|nr:hypothetical protein [Kiritimatiellia bacterium]
MSKCGGIKNRQCFMFSLVLYATTLSLGKTNDITKMPTPTYAHTSKQMLSASRRFAANGLTPSEHLELIVWAEDVASRIEKRFGPLSFFQRSNPLIISAQNDFSMTQAKVIKLQNKTRSPLTQKLIIMNPDRVDEEDVLEGLCWLLMNRYLMAYQSSPMHKRELGTVPDWFATGIAQNLYPIQKKRNRQAIARLTEEGPIYSVSEILEMESLPYGQWRQKLYCGILCAWFDEQKGSLQWIPSAYKQWATGKPLTPEWLARQIGGIDSVQQLENKWQAWLLALSTKKSTELGSLTVDDIVELRQILHLKNKKWTLYIPENLDKPRTLKTLVELKKLTWVKKLGRQLEMEIERIAVGKSSEFQKVVQQYQRLLYNLVSGAKGFSSKENLKSLLLKADKSLAELEQKMTLRNQYMEHVIKRFEHAETNTFSPSLEVKQYLDQIEKRNDLPDSF